MDGSVFPRVWFRYSPNTWADFQLLAWQDQGTLEVRGAELEFRGGRYALVIRDITRLSVVRQGRDFINSWVQVDYVRDGSPAVAYFADGSAAGWGGVLGGTRALYTAIEQSLRRAHDDPAPGR